MRKLLTCIISFTFITFQVLSQTNKEIDLKKHFSKYGVDGSFVLYDESKNEFIRYNSSLCDSLYLPASTFKIPNAVIALEEGIVKDTFQIFKWDGEKWPNDNWNRDHTLRSSMKYSCIWVYRDFAKQIGLVKYSKYLKQFDYGNQNLSSAPEYFWLQGSLGISANQQVSFLRKFYHNQLGVSKKSIDIVKNIIIIEKTNQYIWSGKTGSGQLSETEEILWLVGYLENGNKKYFYAMNFKTNDPDNKRQARYEIPKEVFKELKLID